MTILDYFEWAGLILSTPIALWAIFRLWQIDCRPGKWF